MTIVMVNEQGDLPCNVLGVVEAPIANHATLKNRKPDLHLVHPRSVLGRVDEVKTLTVTSVEL